MQCSCREALSFLTLRQALLRKRLSISTHFDIHSPANVVARRAGPYSLAPWRLTAATWIEYVVSGASFTKVACSGFVPASCRWVFFPGAVALILKPERGSDSLSLDAAAVLGTCR